MQRADGIDYETFLLLKMLDFLSVFGGICFSLGMYYLKKKKKELTDLSRRQSWVSKDKICKKASFLIQFFSE